MSSLLVAPLQSFLCQMKPSRMSVDQFVRALLSLPDSVLMNDLLRRDAVIHLLRMDPALATLYPEFFKGKAVATKKKVKVHMKQA